MYIISPTTSIPDPWVWLRADYSSSMVLINNTTCSAWNDCRGYATGLTSSAGRTPYYTASGYLGKPALRFPTSIANSASYLESPLGTRFNDVISSSNGYSYALAGFINQTSASSVAYMLSLAPELAQTGMRLTNTGQINYTIPISASNGILSSPGINVSVDNSITASTFIIGAFVFSSSIAIRTPGITGSGWRNYAIEVAKSNSFSVPNVLNTRNLGAHTQSIINSNNIIATYPMGTCRLGCRQLIGGSVTNQWQGDMYEILTWNYPLTEQEMASVMMYLERWR